MDHRIIRTEQQLLTLRLRLRDIRTAIRNSHTDQWRNALRQDEWDVLFSIKQLEYQLDNLNDITTEHHPVRHA